MRAISIYAGSLLSVLVASVACEGVAAADSVDATRYEIVERAHNVEMRVDRGFATLVVQRVVANTGPKSDQATFHLEIPFEAVATRLRTAGVDARGETVWFEGELMEAEAAAHKYQELTGIGGYYPKDPALLSWRSQGLLALQVFPVPPQSTKTVEYTLKMPLTYEHGTYRLELPALGTQELPARIHITAVHPEDGINVNGITAAAGGAAGGGITARADRPLSIELRPHGGAVLPCSCVPRAGGTRVCWCRAPGRPVGTCRQPRARACRRLRISRAVLVLALGNPPGRRRGGRYRVRQLVREFGRTRGSICARGAQGRDGEHHRSAPRARDDGAGSRRAVPRASTTGGRHRGQSLGAGG